MVVVPKSASQQWIIRSQPNYRSGQFFLHAARVADGLSGGFVDLEITMLQ